MSKQFLTGPQLEERWQIDRKTLAKLCQASAIGYTMVGKRRRFSMAAIELYELNNTRRPIMPGNNTRRPAR